MAENNVPQGAVPPKISPISKPEGAAPVSPAGAPRPITVRLKPVVPAGAPAAVPPVAPAAPGLAPVTPAPAVVTPPPVASLKATAPVAAMPEPVQPQPQPSPTPGANPLPDGPKPPSAAQVQAAKSKTSRISLDAAIGVAPEKEGPKTIRLKRPSDLSAPSTVMSSAVKPSVGPAAARKTSRIPDSALPIGDGDDSAGVTQKKTLKIKRPGISKPEGEGDASAGGGGDGFDGVQLTPLTSLDFPAKKENTALTAIATICGAVAAVVLLLLTLCLGAHAIGPDAGPNSIASISLGQTELPWAGRIAD